MLKWRCLFVKDFFYLFINVLLLSIDSRLELKRLKMYKSIAKAQKRLKCCES